MTADFAAVQDEAEQRVGVKLFTVLVWIDARHALHRVHSSRPDEYPTGGEKVFARESPWIRRVVVEQQPYLGRDRAAVAAVFDDHEQIGALGCGAVINVPVIDGGLTLGVLNLLDAEGAYGDDSVAAALPLAGLAVPPLRRWHAAAGTLVADRSDQ